MSKYQYAAYGSNLHPLRLKKRVPSARLLGTSALRGYELRFNKKSDVDGSGKCSINTADSIVYLAVFEIASSEKRVLDKIEGLGKGYNETVVRSEDYGDCLTYIADPPAIDESIHPMDWYKAMVLLGCKWNRFPNNYISYIEQFDENSDDDKKRARTNWETVEELRT